MAAAEGLGNCELSTTLRLAQLLLKAASTPLPDEKTNTCSPSRRATSKDGHQEFTGSSHVVWLAAQAASCPVPSCWRRLWDDRGRELFIHEHGVYAPQVVHPMLGYFVSMVSIVLAAAKEDDQAQLLKDVEEFSQRVRMEAAELNSAYTGPMRTELGVDEWYCEATGWFTDVDPGESPRYLLAIIAELQLRLFPPASPRPSEATPTTSRTKTATMGTELSGCKTSALTPSTATPPSAGPPQDADDLISFASSSPLSKTGDVPDLCGFFDVASSPAKSTYSAMEEHELEDTYGFDWSAAAQSKAASAAYFPMDSPRSQATAMSDFEETREESSGLKRSPDLEAAYGCDWTREEFSTPDKRAERASLEYRTPEADAVVLDVAFSSPYETRWQDGETPVQEESVRPQRLDFADCSPPLPPPDDISVEEMQAATVLAQSK
mmetsp:Transcript_1969/g.3687  ORF Transcript_1969/g.3687 Transcript_1969/m.3687 type:complete len:436 (-) Transcript_1969:192-1499(-)|eukprot:CAMPEP_0197661488 /NCGR_PEP_ID=MMETSP1338-20131121/51487_1 /TAXON_ID=43686 ORGANISM="Pelagodinium beii, Strain RCC1491" /NCGR_SAMPLE_ID=MMETSP1338 /ASSEMBLY_ACC=CAM_ASM_000754 /LENGTH=435 /DNA_ID=CAMNT_0043239053 /DNA_START=48 /DNA_END=1355 /DNA_ORIENTATION=+